MEKSLPIAIAIVIAAIIIRNPDKEIANCQYEAINPKGGIFILDKTTGEVYLPTAKKSYLLQGGVLLYDENGAPTNSIFAIDQ